MRFSLVLPTVGKTKELGLFLASLNAQSYREFELIVVDQNPDDRLVPFLEPYADEFPILHLRKKKRGASAARNTGMKHVSGDIVAFPDDDCQYPPDLLDRVVRIFRDHPKLDGVTGRSIGEDGKVSMGRFDTSPGHVDLLNVWTRAIEYTMFFRQGSINGLWFDEEVGPGSGTAWGAGEGTDYLLRLVESGKTLHYDPTIAVVHCSPVPPYNVKAARKAYSYGCGMSHVIRKHELPLWFKAKWLARPLGGTVLSLSDLELHKIRYHWNIFKGRLKGMRS